MPLKANDYHNHLKLKTKAQICYFLLFLSVFFIKITPSLFTIKEGSTSHLGLLPSGEKRKPLLLVARNHFILWLADHQRSRQQQSCGLRYATAWTRIAKELQKGQKPIAARPDAKKLMEAAHPDGQEAHGSNTP